MYPKSSIIALCAAVGFAIHGVTANQCNIVGSGVANCRDNPNSGARIVNQWKVGSPHTFDCRDPTGETVSGDSGWDHSTEGDCWVWEARTDNACCPDCLPKCWWVKE